jgi:hypothetical protein
MTFHTAEDEERVMSRRPESGWVGMIAFAGTMMIMLGSFHLIAGFMALFEEDYFLVGKSGLVLNVDYTAWGWAHLIGGAIAMAAGFALFLGAMWARIVAVVIALLSAIVNIGFMSAYPIWSAIMIALDVLVIYAVTVHGRDALD